MKSKYHKAIGRMDGDTLTLSNQWARVVIEQCFDDENDAIDFRVTGDADIRTFIKLDDAVNYALERLAYYEEGRA